MTKRQRLELELSEKRSAINAMLSKDELTEDERGELSTLTTRAQECEVEFRAAVVAEGETPPLETRTGDREAGELADLITRSSVGDVFAATLDHRVTDGATAELQEHFGIAPNQVALAMLETRAVTPAPADVGQNQAEIIPAVFRWRARRFSGSTCRRSRWARPSIRFSPLRRRSTLRPKMPMRPTPRARSPLRF